MSRKRVPLNQNECTADFRIGVPFEQNLQIMTIDKVYLDKAKTLELGPVEKMIKVILPAAMPSIMSGFITSLRGSFVVLVYAEMYGAKYGMGFYVKKYAEYGLYSEAWSGFVFMVVVLVIVMQLFEKMKNRILKWTLN